MFPQLDHQRRVIAKSMKRHKKVPPRNIHRKDYGNDGHKKHQSNKGSEKYRKKYGSDSENSTTKDFFMHRSKVKRDDKLPKAYRLNSKKKYSDDESVKYTDSEEENIVENDNLIRDSDFTSDNDEVS